MRTKKRAIIALTQAVALGLLAVGVLLSMANRLAAEERLKPTTGKPDSDSLAPFLERHCADCHSGGANEGKFSLDELKNSITQENAATWLKVAERIDNGEMPPDEAPRPDEVARQLAVRFLATELAKFKLPTSHLGDGPLGNHLDHDLIFSGDSQAPLNNPPRLWRYSPEIYARWILRKDSVHDAPGQAMTPAGGQTFPDQSQGLSIDEGTLSVVLRNAQEVAERNTRHEIVDGRMVLLEGAAQGLQDVLAAGSQPTFEQFAKVVERFAFYRRFTNLSEEEMKRLFGLYERAAANGDPLVGLRAVFVAIQLQPQALYRMEFGLGPADERGNRTLAPRELAYAISFALGDRLEWSVFEEAKTGKLAARADVERVVRQLLDRPPHENPRILRFFQQYFGYTVAPDVFKDKALNPHFFAPALVVDTDQLIAVILGEDKHVLKELLTTNRSFIGTRWDFAKDRGEPTYPKERNYTTYGLDHFPDRQPIALPAEQRAGILTQPSWLVAQSGNFDNHPVQRGKWIREKLLGQVIPPVPITVNAQVPDDKTRTLRDRVVEVTKAEFCAQCHRKMNPLGLPFEQFDHFGRYRTTDTVEDATKPPLPGKEKNDPPVPATAHPPIDSSGAIDFAGDAAIEGPVENPVVMLRRLADSPRVRQVFVRHTFRYWMGRDENLGDAATLIAADKAYVESGGSMKALIVSLLTSDSFLLRSQPQLTDPLSPEPN